MVFQKIQSLVPRGLAYRIFSEHIHPYLKQFFMAFGCMLLAAISTAALPYLLKPVFDTVFSQPDPKKLGLLCAAVFGSFVLKGATSYGESLIMTFIGQRIISDLQNRLFKHLMRLDLAFFHATNSGQLLSRFSNDVNLMRGAVTNTLVGLGKDTFTVLFLVLLMFQRDWFLACITFVLFPAAVLPIIKIGKSMRKVTDRTQEQLGQFTTHLGQVFQGMRVVKAYGMETYEIDRTNSIIERIFRLIFKNTRIRSISHPIIEGLGGLAIVSILAYGGWQVMEGTRTPGTFVSFIGALLLVYEPLKRLSNLNATLQEGIAAAKRVFTIIDTPSHIVDSPRATTLKTVQKGIEIQNLHFTYPSGKVALDKISLSIPQGKTIALVGPSGSGKSTLINLIPRFYDVSEGVIQIDGTDVRNLTLKSLRSQIALVSQEIHLFDDTIRNNIAYGTWDAPMADIQKAAETAAAHTFIQQLPQGYDTLVGENGIKVSGGQRQRIAIARALLKNAPILLLDEATSSLDTDSERRVQSALDTLMKGRTTVVVAHRLSTIVNADCIYVLDQGEIVESGTHNQLLKKAGVYARLWQAQSEFQSTEPLVA